MNTLVIIKLLLLVAASLASEESTEQPQQKVNVAVYYEALCPDSIKFFNEQLTPHLDIINKYVELKHVPFGRATHELINGVWKSTCRHTATECTGHEVMACALLKEGSEYLRNNFISCLMKRGDRNKPYPTTECSKETMFPGDNVAFVKCISDKQYDQKLEDLKRETESLQPPLKNVPTIVFNEVFQQSDQDMALKHFARVLCQYIQQDNTTVPECHAHNGAAAANTVISLLLLVAGVIVGFCQF